MDDNEDSTSEALSAERIKLRQIFRAAQSSARWDKIQLSLAPILFRQAHVDPPQIFNTAHMRFDGVSRVGNRQLNIYTGRSNQSFWSARLRYSQTQGSEEYRVYTDIWVNPTKWERMERARSGEALQLGTSYDRAANVVPMEPVVPPYQEALARALREALAELLCLLSGENVDPLSFEGLREFRLPSFGIGSPINVNLSGWSLRHWEHYVDLPTSDARLDVLRAWDRAQAQFRAFTGRVYDAAQPDDDRLRGEFRRSELSYSVNIPVSYQRQIAIYAKAEDRVRYEVRWIKDRYSSAVGPNGEQVGDYRECGVEGLLDFLELHRRSALRQFQSTAARLLAPPSLDRSRASLESFADLMETILRSRQSTDLKVDAVRQLIETGSYLKPELDGGRDMLNYLGRSGVIGRSSGRGQPRLPNDEFALSLAAIRNALLSP